MGGQDPAAVDLLDESILQTLSMLGERRGKDLLGQLFGLFLEQGPTSFSSLRGALASGDAAEVKSTAHSLKGSYRSLGTPRLAELSRQLEEMGSSGQLAGGESILAELELCFGQTSEALRSFLASRGGDSDQAG